MTESDLNEDWRVQLRDGRISTPFQHYLIVAAGIAGQLVDGLECPPGPAVMAIKGWATDADEAVAMIRFVSEEVGFSITDEVQVLPAELDLPPRERPYAYCITFLPYSDGNDSDE